MGNNWGFRITRASSLVNLGRRSAEPRPNLDQHPDRPSDLATSLPYVEKLAVARQTSASCGGCKGNLG